MENNIFINKNRERIRRGKLECFDDLPFEKKEVFVKIKTILSEHFNKEVEVYVFGSHYWGNWDEQSDYDVLLYKDCDFDLPEKLTELIKIKVDVFCYDEEPRGILIP